MNNRVQIFLQDHNFALSCARPPAIGEENDVVSVDGRQSTHSSISGKSEVSTATPRRSDMDLGFEPEGSASPMIPCERWKLSLHNVLEDSDGIRIFRQFLVETNQEKFLDCLLACKGFKDFGLRNLCSNASTGASSPASSVSSHRGQSEADTKQTRWKVAKKIFTEYLKNKKDKSFTVASIIKDGTRQYICKQIKQSQSSGLTPFELSSNLFDQVQVEIERYIENKLYSSFIKSEVLFNYAMQHEKLHAKSTAATSNAVNQNENQDASSPQVNPANLSQGRYGYLPPLDENKVWAPIIRPGSTDNGVSSSMNPRGSSSSRDSLARAAMKNNYINNVSSNPGSYHESDQSNPAYPYLVAPSAPKYYVPPASANASDNASSDATSDTLSITDGSIDFEGTSTYNVKKHQKRIVRHHVKRNPNLYNPAEENFVSLTRRCQSKQSMATLATDNPVAFFTQLKDKLEKVAEERRRVELLEAHQDTEDILGQHIERVMKTPNLMESPSRNSSPPPLGNLPYTNSSKMRDPTFPGSSAYDANYNKRFNRGNNMPLLQNGHKNQHMDASKRMEASRKFRDIRVGIAPNQVPDVPEVPGQPLDKHSFIHEWIKQQDSIGDPSNPQQKKGASSKPFKYINPRDDFPKQSAASKAFHERLRQPIAQDMNMPPLSGPDHHTILDEVKRRLIAETESKDSCTNFLMPNTLPDTHPLSEARYNAQLGKKLIPVPSSCPSTVTETAASLEELNMKSRPSHIITTCLYKLPKEEMHYKTHIPGNQITLEQFKNCIQRKGNFKYYFKQYSQEVHGAVYFEIKENSDILPLWNNSIVAKLEDINL